VSDALVVLRQKLPGLRAAERRVADAIIAKPALVVESTITELAAACDTSPATVARLCKSIGFGGYKSFRMAVAAAASVEQAARKLFRVDEADIGPTDSTADVIAKVAFQEARAIEETARGIDPEAVDRVAAAIRSADRVEVFGIGSSGLTAQDLQLKLHRVGIVANCWSDTHLALTSAVVTTQNSVAVAVSHSGVTAETRAFLTAVRSNGGLTVAITNHPDSPVAECADVVLATSTRESGIRTGAMSSRTAQMAIVDFVVVRLIQSDFTRAQILLKRTYEAMHPARD
jgi:DNA-binding MurR/RpiR family transcriptional regulator